MKALKLLRFRISISVFMSSVFMSIVVMPSWAFAANAAGNSTPNGSGGGGDWTPKIAAYFSESKKKLGDLEPWQSKLFDEEAVPDYQRFVRDYHSDAQQSVEIDFESLKNFLKFYAPKAIKSSGTTAPGVLVILKPESTCAKCVSAQPAVKTLVAERLERRGLRPIWATPGEMASVRAQGSDPQALANQLALTKKAIGTLVISWQVIVDDDIDSAHADEVRYQIRSALHLSSSDADASDLSAAEATLEVADNGSFEKSSGQLLADAFTEIGAKLRRAEVVQTEASRAELSIEVRGWTTYGEFQKLRAALEDQLKSLGSIEELTIARGKATFAVHSGGSPQDVLKSISSIQIAGFSHPPASLDSQVIRVEFQPAPQGGSVQ